MGSVRSDHVGQRRGVPGCGGLPRSLCLPRVWTRHPARLATSAAVTAAPGLPAERWEGADLRGGTQGRGAPEPPALRAALRRPGVGSRRAPVRCGVGAGWCPRVARHLRQVAAASQGNLVPPLTSGPLKPEGKENARSGGRGSVSLYFPYSKSH